MIEELGMSAYRLVHNMGKEFWDIAHTIIYGVTEPAREAAAAWEPIRNMLILLPLPVILFAVMTAFFIRSYRKPEKVLKSTTVEQLEARGREPKKYLRFWRIEMALAMLFAFAFSVFVVMSVYATDGSDALKIATSYIMYSLVAYAVVIGLLAYFGRGYYFGRWGIRFIAITQGGPPIPRSGSGYTM